MQWQHQAQANPGQPFTGYPYQWKPYPWYHGSIPMHHRLATKATRAPMEVYQLVMGQILPSAPSRRAGQLDRVWERIPTRVFKMRVTVLACVVRVRAQIPTRLLHQVSSHTKSSLPVAGRNSATRFTPRQPTDQSYGSSLSN